jgi:hypothetical protein
MKAQPNQIFHTPKNSKMMHPKAVECFKGLVVRQLKRHMSNFFFKIKKNVENFFKKMSKIFSKKRRKKRRKIFIMSVYKFSKKRRKKRRE